MQRALALARQALWLTSPNPRVGCVITAADGSVLGEGHTQRAGGPHAEIMALRDAAARGHSVQGATAWVTLEPCAHQGRTGPCCDALAVAGIGRVVSAMTDPNPKVAGQGLARLQAAGAQVQTLAPTSDEALQARELNIGFFSRMERGLPWVRMKIAASLDGQTSLQNGQSQWITSEPARTDGHAWRKRAGALLTGIGTALVLFTVPLSFTIEGVSIPFIQLLMRGDVLVIATFILGLYLFNISVPISCRDAFRVVPPERMNASSSPLPRTCTGFTADSGTCTKSSRTAPKSSTA